MGKSKTDTKGEANGDVVEGSATPSTKDPKKGKKSRKNKDVDWEDEVAKELEDMTLEEVGEKKEEESREPSPVLEKKEKKKEKKSKKVKSKDSDDEEIVSKKGGGFALLMAEDEDDHDSDEPVIEEKKPKKKSKKDEKPKREEKPKKEEKAKKPVNSDDDDDEEVIHTKKGGGFAALMEDDDDDFDEDMDEQIAEEKKDMKKKAKKEEKPKPAPVEDKKKGKKGRKKKNEEEDLDQILAELELEYKGEKPKEESVKEAAEELTPSVEESSKKKKKKKKDASIESEKPQEENNDTNKVPEKVVPVIETSPVVDLKVTLATRKDTLMAEEVPQEAVNVIRPSAEAMEVDKAKPTESGKSEISEKVEETAAEPAKAKKKKKKAKDTAAPASEESKEGTPAPDDGECAAGDEDGTGKKKGKKKKEAEEDKDARKGKPSKKALAAMREILAKQKEEEDRLKKEEEERQRIEEERLKQIEEEKRLEQERKERKKQKEKERKERLKAEGKLLTPKQKADQKRAQQMLEHLKAQGLAVPEVGEKKPRLGTRIKPKKKKDQESAQEEPEPSPSPVLEEKPVEEEKPEEQEVVEEVKEEEVKDAWDETSDEEEDDTSEATEKKIKNNVKKPDDEEEDEEDEDDDDSAGSESEEESLEEHKGEAEKRKQRALDRMAKRKEENLKKLDPENLRAPVVCVLGHVDHGKTKILDKLRRSNVQEGEVGGITQQIGATNVPAYAIRKQTHMVKDFEMDDIRFPGLLIIDTPGHESFRNLRSRGSSLCDIAILVVDVTQGLEPQTKESINLLRKRATPFLVALNKVDRVYEWVSHPSKDIRDMINLQEEPSKNDFERRTSHIIQGLREEKLNSALFWENPNPKEYLSLVPTSAISGDGMGNLISLICNLCQQRLKKNLMFSEELQCTVLEVKTIQGHGTTIDVILVNGRLREGDTIILAGTEGPIVTQIRSLLLPKPLKEIRVKGQYDEVKEISAAQGVKIAARDLEKAIPGLSLKVAYHEDEVDIIKEEVDREFHSAMRSMKVKERGVYVQASTLGALEALLEFFKTNDVPYSGIRVGPVVKRDVMRAAAMLEHDPMYAVILAFDVKVEKDAQELADKEGVKIFSEETIYHLGDRYVDYLKEYKKKKQDEFRHIAVFPSRLRIIPTAIFNKRDPIVLGVNIESGVLRTGTPLCVPSKEFVEIGIVTSMEFDHKNVDIAKKGDEVCIKIENVPGHTPKLFGRHFEADDLLVSKISRESINACKDYFRDDLSKTDWKLMLELKKQFQIL